MTGVDERVDSGVTLRWSRPDDHGRHTRLDVVLAVAPAAEPLWSTLRRVQRRIPGSVRVVVLHVSGPIPLPPPGPEQVRHYQRAFDWRSDPSYVSVAVVSETANAPGTDLILGCDLRLMSADAILTFAPNPLGAGRLAAAVGYSRALELSLAGGAMTADRALASGLIQRVASPGDLAAEVEELVNQLLTPDRSRAREVKALLLRAENGPRDDQSAAERAAALRLHAEQEIASQDGAAGD